MNDSASSFETEESQPPVQAAADDPEERLGAEFLETPEEADAARPPADEAAVSTSAFPRNRSRSSGSPRTTRNKKPKAKGRNAFLAKMIVYGGTALLSLAVLVAASYKVPLLLHNGGYIDQPYIWPWTLLQRGDSEGSVYQTQDGRTLSVADHDELVERAGYVIGDVRSLYKDAQREYTDFQNLEDEKARYEALDRACEMAQQAFEQILELQDELAPHRDISPTLNARLDSTDKLVEGLGMKVSQWRQQKR